MDTWYAFTPTVASVEGNSIHELHEMMQDCRYGHVTWNWHSAEDRSNFELDIKNICNVQDGFRCCVWVITFIFKIHGWKDTYFRHSVVPVISLVCKSSLIKTRGPFSCWRSDVCAEIFSFHRFNPLHTLKYMVYLLTLIGKVYPCCCSTVKTDKVWSGHSGDY
jgi:hypothetical protein